jgi:hypothetical protein
MFLSKASSRLLLTLLGIAITAHPNICEAKPLAGELIVVPADKLPRQAQQQGQASAPAVSYATGRASVTRSTMTRSS